MVHENPQARGRARHRKRLPVTAAQAAQAGIWEIHRALPHLLHATPLQQTICPAPGPVVLPEPSGRRLCRDVRGVAQPELGLANAVRELARVEKARIRRRADARARGRSAYTVDPQAHCLVWKAVPGAAPAPRINPWVVAR